MERLDRLDDPRVKLVAALLQKPAVRDVLGERVREGVLRVRIEPGLVEELGRPQVVESTTERLVRQVGDRLEQRERDVLADDGGGLQQMLVLREQPIDARREHHLDRGRDLDRLDRVGPPIPSALPGQRLRLHQVRTVSSRKNGFPRLTRSCLSGASPGSSPRSASSSSPALSAGSASSRSWL